MKKILAGLCLLGFIWLTAGAAPAALRETIPAERPLIVGVTVDPPYCMKDAHGKWVGLTVDLWTLAAREMNRPFVLREMNFGDILTSLEKGTIDVSIEPLYLTAEREAKFDLSTPLGVSRMAVATLYQAKDHPWWKAVRTVFSWGTLKVVFSLLLALIFIGLLFWVIERKNNPEHFGGKIHRGVGTGIYWAGSTLASGVCFGISLKSLAGRIMGLVWMMICAVALSAVIASLATSLMAFYAGESILQTGELRRMHLGTEKSSLPAFLLAKIGGHHTLYHSEAASFNALMDGKIEGYLADEITLHAYAEGDYKGKISITPTNLRRRAFAMAMPKDSPLRRPLNVALLKTMHSTAWDVILNRYGFEKNLEPIPTQGGTGIEGRSQPGMRQ